MEENQTSTVKILNYLYIIRYAIYNCMLCTIQRDLRNKLPEIPEYNVYIAHNIGRNLPFQYPANNTVQLLLFYYAGRQFLA